MMKTITFLILFCFFFSFDVQSKTDIEKINYEIYQYLDSCYNPKVKCFIVPSEFDYIENRVINDTLKLSDWDEIRRNNRCTRHLDTILQKSEIYKPIFKEFNKFWKFEIEKIVRKGYVYYLKNKKFDFNKELDSLRKIKYIYDSTESVWAKADTINRCYIPKDLNDALKTLDNILTDETMHRFLTYNEEDDAVASEHFGIGIFIRQNWKIGSSRIGKYFENKGITIPDLISSYIIRAYYRKLNNKPLNLEELDKKYLDYQKLNEVEDD